jgi:hypothetical protein
MNKYFKTLIILLSLGIANDLFVEALADSPYEKAKMPCVEEVCVGDDIQALKSINWLPVDKELVSNQNRGWKVIGDAKSLQSLLPYLSGGVIDKKGIKFLPQIRGFCTRPNGNPIFLGHYTGKDGKPVEIRFGILPSLDRKSQKIVVSEIKKRISNTGISSSQVGSLYAEAQKRYPSSNKAIAATTMLVQSDMNQGKVTSVNLRLFYRDGLLGAGSADSLLEFPGCVGKVEL